MISKLEKNRILALFLTLVVAGTIFYLSSLEFSSPPGGGFSILPYIYHFAIFFIFALFLLITIKGENETEKKHIFLVLIIAILYAALDEIHQSFVPGRHTSVIDLLVDTLGITFSIGFYEKLREFSILRKLGLRKSEKQKINKL